jgi:hypothetical protein
MGVQSTIEITREEAQRKWIEIQLEKTKEALELVVLELDNTNLQDQLEEEFHNYMIVG